LSPPDTYPRLIAAPIVTVSEQPQPDKTPPEYPGIQRAVFKGPTDRIICVAIGKGGIVAAGGADKTVRVWDAATGKEQHVLRHTNTVQSLAISQDGKVLIAGDADMMVLLWNLETGEKLATLKGLGEPVRQVALSTDGKTVAAAGAKSGKLWDVDTGKVKMDFAGRFALSPDGKSLATLRADGSIALLDVPTGKERITLDGHKGNVNSLTFSPDGKTLVSGGADRRGRSATGKEEGQDNTIKLWDLATGKASASLAGHLKGIYSLTFAPDGKTLVAADFNGSMKLWDVGSGKVRAALEKIKIGEKLQGTPVGYWAIAPDLKTWAVGAGREVQLLDIAEFAGAEK
jgi:WD40 repeat protein